MHATFVSPGRFRTTARMRCRKHPVSQQGIHSSRLRLSSTDRRLARRNARHEILLELGMALIFEGRHWA
jgi:hypothetical protein